MGKNRKIRYFSLAAIKNSKGEYITKEHMEQFSYMYIGSEDVDTITKRIGDRQLYRAKMNDEQWKSYTNNKGVKIIDKWQ